MDAVIGLNYSTEELQWIVGDPEGWKEDYSNYFFNPIGEELEWQWEQHAAKKIGRAHV